MNRRVRPEELTGDFEHDSRLGYETTFRFWDLFDVLPKGVGTVILALVGLVCAVTCVWALKADNVLAAVVAGPAAGAIATRLLITLDAKVGR